MERALVLRTCYSDMQSHRGFQWPKSGVVYAPDWDPEPKCGRGLHGLLRGEGEGSLLYWEEYANWLVCSVDPGRIVDLNGKVKFPECEVVHVGDQGSATSYIHTHLGYPSNFNPIVGGTATDGKHGKAMAGNYGTATVDDFGQATAGDYGQATAGDFGQATAGRSGLATARNHSQVMAGTFGIATAGDYGTAVSGEYGRSTTGRGGRSESGQSGVVQAGELGSISLPFWDANVDRYRVIVGYIGEGGLEPDVAYKCENFKFVKVCATK